MQLQAAIGADDHRGSREHRGKATRQGCSNRGIHSPVACFRARPSRNPTFPSGRHIQVPDVGKPPGNLAQSAHTYKQLLLNSLTGK
jgi:hypothetical protein